MRPHRSCLSGGAFADALARREGGPTFEGLKLLLCENPLPPIDAAIAAAQAEAPRGNYYTEPYSAPLRRLIAEQLKVPERLIHINAGSELILRQLFDRLGDRVRLLTPTYALFPEIARRVTETPLLPERAFAFDLAGLEVPRDTTLVVIVNPNNPNGGTFAGAGRRSEHARRRVSARSPEPGRRAGDGPPRPRRPHLPDRNLLLPGGLRAS